MSFTGNYQVKQDGYISTVLGCNIGKNTSIHLKKGYSNPFHQGGLLDIIFSVRINKSPKICVNYYQPLEKNLDFNSPTQAKIYTLLAQREIFSNMKIDKYKFQIPLHSFFQHMISLNGNCIQPFDIQGLKDENKQYYKLSLAGNLFFSEVSGDFSVLLREKKYNPFLKLHILKNFPIGGGFSLLTSIGGLLSRSPLPLPERFHHGTVPLFRGFKTNEFSKKVQGTSIGNENFFSLALDWKHSLLDRFGLNFHGFLSGSLAFNWHTYSEEKNPLYFLAAGTGLTLDNVGIQVEVNGQYPLLLAENLSFHRFQIGFNISFDNFQVSQ